MSDPPSREDRASREGSRPSSTGPLSLVAVIVVGAGLGTAAWVAGAGADAASATRLEVFAAEMRSQEGSGVDPTDAWLEVGRRALASPSLVSIPFRESERFPADRLAASAYAFHLREGQVVEARVSNPPPSRSFVELYRAPGGEDGEPAFVAESDSAGLPLVHEARATAEFVLRVVPEPYAGGTYTVDLSSRPAFAFPVLERGPNAVISRYGDPRDNGLRDHEGIDVYAPSGTPVVAATRALVYDVGTSGRGGNYVWLQDWAREKEIYYAHLEESWVDVGMVVEPGDPIGSVGNTGNAEATVPHLHFAIYDLERRPTDPLPYVVPLEALRTASAVESP